jgi:hypothetical protein
LYDDGLRASGIAALGYVRWWLGLRALRLGSFQIVALG